MSIEKNTKIKSLFADWPKNAIMTTISLKQHGFSDQLIQKYCASGWLTRIGTGGFVRHSEEPTWSGALYAIQFELNKPIHVGGLSALEIQGLSHYVQLSSEKLHHLYNTTGCRHILPRWFAYFNQKNHFQYIQFHLFDEEIGLIKKRVEDSDMMISRPERAILEALYLVPKHLSLEHAGQLIENLQTIHPDHMQKLLESCRHILVKRLFLLLAELHNLPVLKHLDDSRIHLGSGERTIAPGGKYFSKYKLNLPYNGQDIEEEFYV